MFGKIVKEGELGNLLDINIFIWIY
jgi:hypothetical protein